MDARNLDEAFEECLTAVLEGRRSIEECKARYPQWASELESLLETALELSSALAVSPSPEFARQARQRFLAALARRRAPARSWRPLLRWAPALAGGLLAIAILAAVGAVVLSRDEGPGEPATVRLVSTHIEQAQKNLQSLESALQRGEPIRQEWVHEMRVSTSQLLESLRDAEALSPEEASAIVEVLNRQISLLSSIQSQLPEDGAQDAPQSRYRESQSLDGPEGP